MSNHFFNFKQFTVYQDKCAMKVCTDACILGAWAAGKAENFFVKEILDIGTGTGLLSLMIAQKTIGSLDAVEINNEAAVQAAQNVAASPWQKRIQVIHSSIAALETGKKYDMIISNPPFFEDDLRSDNQMKNEAKHDTTLKLDELLPYVNKFMSETGSAFILLPYHRTVYFETLAKKLSLFTCEKLYIKQTPGRDYFRTVIMLSKNEIPATIHSLVIHDEHRNYTAGFKELMKDYYLKL